MTADPADARDAGEQPPVGDGGYVHDPEDGDYDDGDEEEEPYIHDPEGVRPHQAPPSEDGFDWRGWLLVGVIVFAFFVAPGSLLVLPAVQGAVKSLGLTLRDAYLVLPLVPAFALGAVAVWAAVRSRV
jgi:hypothetical protein